MKVVQIKDLLEGDLFPLPDHPGHFAQVLKAHLISTSTKIHVTYEIGCKHSFPNIVWGCLDQEAKAEISVYDRQELTEHNKYRMIFAREVEGGQTIRLEGDNTEWLVVSKPSLSDALIHLHVLSLENQYEVFKLEPDHIVMMKEE